MEAANKILEDQNKELQNQVKDFETVQNELAVANEALERHEKRNKDIVKSLEMIETQNALNSQNLQNVIEENLELKSAMEVLKTQNEFLKEKEKKLFKCQKELSEVEYVKSSCQAKMGELNVCKSEITKLATVVEERLTQVQAKDDDLVSFREKNSFLQQNLKDATRAIERFNTNLENKNKAVKELEEQLNSCEVEKRERTERENKEDKDAVATTEGDCQSPCTISKLTGNDLIAMEDKDEKMDTMRVENEILTKKLENLEENLALCENKGIVPSISRSTSNLLINELLS